MIKHNFLTFVLNIAYTSSYFETVRYLNEYTTIAWLEQHKAIILYSLIEQIKQ